MNEIENILCQLDLAEQRLAPFVAAHDECIGDEKKSWVTNNDRALLSRVMAAIVAARQEDDGSGPYQEGGGGIGITSAPISPSLALSTALDYLKRHQLTGSPFMSPLMSPISRKTLTKSTLLLSSPIRR